MSISKNLGTVPSSTPSNALRPDLDWSQVRETIAMLSLAVAQIRCTMTDGDQSLNSLTESFTEMAGKLQHIHSLVADPATDYNKLCHEVTSDAERSMLLTQKAITAFQFYDRLSQRLDHVAHSLDRLSCLIGDPQQLYNPQAWRAVQEEVKGSYSMECERIMFEHIMQGATIDEALAIYKHHFTLEQQQPDNTDDEIELF